MVSVLGFAITINYFSMHAVAAIPITKPIVNVPLNSSFSDYLTSPFTMGINLFVK